MSSIFAIAGYTCAPATITYDDDDNLINVVMNLGPKGTYTYKTDNIPSGNLHPFAGQIFYNDLATLDTTQGVGYKLRTGGKYAVVTIGDEDQPTTVAAYNERIVGKKSNEGEGDWTLAQVKAGRRSPKAPASSAGDDY
ncbi:hypothetical protein AG1IA_10161 [Rhizoctonia solani AG-1 IA]|uniref:Uncharacterized protein n=1 Tax=Thanatephorus cucumeris (strain AG1-IA) TaxID=983506 RepID=L8WHH7_THACA|nr:hypothetical protein AG1IA_10161 [Rhizoctonia solani AG-1 IA]